MSNLFHIYDAVVKNIRTGLGSFRDKSSLTALSGQLQTEEAYNTSDIGQRMVDLEAEDGTRAGIRLIPDNTILPDLSILDTTKDAWQQARLYGKSFIYINCVDAGTTESDLNDSSSYTIQNFLVFHRYELEPVESSIVESIDDPDYGMPVLYQIKGTSTRIHISRLIIFYGDQVSKTQFKKNKFSHASVLERRSQFIENFDSSAQALAHLLQEYRTLVMKVKDLQNIQNSPEKLQALKERLAKIQECVGLFHMLLCGEDEGYSYIGEQVQGAGDLYNTQKARLQAASPNIPHTILFNENPGEGLSGHGGSQKIAWYDYVSQKQETYLRPRLERIFELIFNSTEAPKGISWEEFSFEFNPLYHESKTDKTERQYKEAQTDKLYLDAGVLEEGQVMEKIKARYPDMKAVKK